jgi:glycosyltransferase involved in cell wall biosynthesis
LRRLQRSPCVISIDCTQPLARSENPSTLAGVTYQPNIVHDGLVFRRAAAIISTSRWAADDLARTYPDCADKIEVMPYPVLFAHFETDWIEERYARALLGPVRVLFIGGDFERKGGPVLLQAWRNGGLAADAVLDLVTDWRVGDVPPGVHVIRGIRSYTTPWQQLWRRADLFVMPTRAEAFGMVYQEAAAAGLPAVGTRLNAIPELIDHGITGLLVPCGDPSALVGALRALVSSAALRRTMGTAARRKIEHLGSPQRYGERLTSLIKRIARN